MNKPLRPATRLLRAGRPHAGWVNTPVTRASTYVFDSVAAWRDTRARREQERLPSYGARGTDSTHALEDALVELEPVSYTHLDVYKRQVLDTATGPAVCHVPRETSPRLTVGIRCST